MSAVVILPYVKPCYNWFVPQPTYQDGYNQAKKDIQKQAANALEKTLVHIAKDNKKLDEKKVVPSVYFDERRQMLLLPRYNLKLLGDDYIVRKPLRGDWTDAWFMTASASEYLDRRIRENLSKASVSFDEDKISLAKREISKSMQDIICKIAKR